MAGYGRKSQENHKVIRGVQIISIILAVLVFLLFVYWSVLEPVFAWIYFPKTIHEGSVFYNKEIYLQCEDGILFNEFLTLLELPLEKDVVYFYHGDNRVMDNPIYGKANDVFAVDFRINISEYTKIKKRYALVENYCAQDTDFTIYLCDFGVRSDVKTALAFNDSHQIVRCILITQVRNLPSNYTFYKILYRRSAIPFSIAG